MQAIRGFVWPVLIGFGLLLVLAQSWHYSSVGAPGGVLLQQGELRSVGAQPNRSERQATLVSLPHVMLANRSDVAALWVLEAPLTLTGSELQALLIGQVAGSVELYLNESKISAVSYGASTMLDIGYRPLFVTLPTPARDTVYRLRLLLRPDADGRAGLDRIHVGPYKDVEHRFYRLWFQNVGAYIVAVSAAALALCLTMIIWRGTTEPAYRDFAIASAASLAFFAGHLVFGSGPVPPWHAFVLSASWLVFTAYVLRSATRIASRKPSRKPAIILSFLGSALLLAALACWFQWRELLVCVLISGHVFGVALALQIGFEQRRQGTAELRVFVAAMILAGIIGGVDLALSLNADQGFGRPPFGLGSTMMVLLTIFVFSVYQYLQDSAVIRDWNQQLTLQVQRAEAELQAIYDKLLVRERHAAIVAERHRILKEMHDGVGGQLVATMSLAQHEQTPRSEIINALDTCITELRLAIDSLDPAHSDLLNALSALRARLLPVLDRSGISLGWSVRELENRKAMSPDQVLQTFRILQEGVSNVIKHSGASRAALICGYSDRFGIVWLTLRDNGYARTPADPLATGYGLRNMRSRAEAIGAELSVRLGSREHPGSRVRLIWRVAGPAGAVAGVR